MMQISRLKGPGKERLTIQTNAAALTSALLKEDNESAVYEMVEGFKFIRANYAQAC